MASRCVWAVCGIGRAIYIAAQGKRLIALHAFIKKTQKTPSQAIDLALMRMKEIES
ncbi:MAG: type II toxin-antitoxin system RelE/ParE family toxin [Gammaproteobacteria bacterium]